MKEKLRNSSLKAAADLKDRRFSQVLPLEDLEVGETTEEAEDTEDLFALFEHKDSARYVYDLFQTSAAGLDH